MKLYRTEGVLDLSMVSRKTIVFLGSGSLGSLTLANLAYPWKRIILVDPENLESDNIERHLLGRNEIGRPKAEGVARWLVDRGINPDTIETHVCGAEEVLDQIERPDLLVVNVDKRSVNDWINRWSMTNNVPAIYGGIYPNGTGGQIFVILSPKDICYQCAQFMMGGSREEPQEHIDYGIDPSTIVSESGDIHGVSALRWAVGSLASDMADLSLEVLSGDKIEPQVLVHSNEWEPLLVLSPGEELTALASYISNQASLGLVSSSRIRPYPGGKFVFEAKRAIIGLRLNQWSACAEHMAQISAENI